VKEFKNIDEILDFAINAEQEAVDFYSGLSDRASNNEMKEVFLQFAREEMGHKARLMKIKEEGLYNLRNEKVQDLKISDYLVDITPDPNISYQDALVLAMKKEKAAFKLYMDLASKAPNKEFENVFVSLAEEESRHKLRFELEYDDFILKEN